MSCQYTLNIIRTFNTPIETLFSMWIDSNHLKQWWAPKGFTIDVVSLDLRPTGIFQ